MVTIVTPKNRVHNVINVALSLRQLESEGKKTKVEFLAPSEIENFWNNLEEYVDKTDKSLIILDVPHPVASDIAKLKIGPWKNAILYFTSENNPLTKDEREGLLNHGISIVPERKSYECFMGDITGQNEKWVNASKILTLEDQDIPLQSKERNIIKGLIQSALTSPKETIRKIQEDAFDYFGKIGKKQPEVTIKTKHGDYFIVQVKHNLAAAVSAVYSSYLDDKPEPLIVDGKHKGLLTRNPTFFMSIMKQMGNEESAIKFGKAAFFCFDNSVNTNELLTLAGRGRCEGFLLKIGEPQFMSHKTLHRKLIGGTTSETKGEEKYNKRYRSLADEYTGIAFLAQNCIKVPDGALEDVVGLLHKSGTSFQLVGCSPSQIAVQ
jgi:hypothetical protein